MSDKAESSGAPVDPGAPSGIDSDRFSVAQEWHLARSKSETSLANFEFALMAASAAFERYVIQTVRMVGGPELSVSEAVIAHVVRMQDRPKDAATIARFLNRDDLPNVQYALRKLVSVGLIEKTKSGAITVFGATPEGIEWTERYAAVRAKVLLELATSDESFVGRLPPTSRAIAVLAGMYDAASRSAAVLNPGTLFDKS